MLLNRRIFDFGQNFGTIREYALTTPNGVNLSSISTEESEMKKSLMLSSLMLIATAAKAIAAEPSDAIVNEAHKRTLIPVRYDPKYVKLTYPGGDVSQDTGVCTDVIIRTYREAFGFDFQKAVHEDMKHNFSAYPTIWGLKRPDKNIDHRRVPNLEAYLNRQKANLTISRNAKDYQPGDIVSWRLGGILPHIGIVSDNKALDGTPLIIHNIGAGPVEDNMLFATDIHGHFRFIPDDIIAENN